MDITIEFCGSDRKFVAFLDGRFVGYLKYKFPKDMGDRRNVEIKYIQVIPAMRRKGVATKLIKHFLEYTMDCVWISLWTGKESEVNKTYDLYEKCGFEQRAVQEDYYEPGVPTRLFVKKNG